MDVVCFGSGLIRSPRRNSKLVLSLEILPGSVKTVFGTELLSSPPPPITPDLAWGTEEKGARGAGRVFMNDFLPGCFLAVVI